MKMHKDLKFASGCCVAVVFGILLGWVIFPLILKAQLKKEMALTQNTDVRQMWQKIPFALDFKVYLFNYTNADEVQKGGVPIVQEVGPYYFEGYIQNENRGLHLYGELRDQIGSLVKLPKVLCRILREWKEKVEVEDHENEDTITYKKMDTFIFRSDLSGEGLTGEEIITMPHVFMMAMATVVTREKPAMLNMLGKAFNGLFNNPADVFVRVKALDILFRGIIINCDQKEFAPKAVCTALRKESASGLILEPNNQFRFSLFGMRNGTIDPHVVKVKRGKTNVMDVGQVIAIDDQPKLEIWRDTCNNFDGTDGTVFPPFLTEKDRLKSYSPDLCRSFKPRYQKKTSYEGIETNRYVATIGDLANDPELQCFCDTPETCPKKGLMDIMKCIKAPMIVSMPHFLDCDPSLMENVKGLHPNVKRHGIEIDFEPISGTPMVAKQRIQFNMLLLKSVKLELWRELPDTIAPLFWIEEGLSLNKTFVKMLKHQLFMPKKAVGMLSWILVSFGILGAVGGVVYHYRDQIMMYATGPNSNSSSRGGAGSAGFRVSPHQPGKDISIIGQAEPSKITM